MRSVLLFYDLFQFFEKCIDIGLVIVEKQTYPACSRFLDMLVQWICAVTAAADADILGCEPLSDDIGIFYVGERKREDAYPFFGII